MTDEQIAQLLGVLERIANELAKMNSHFETIDPEEIAIHLESIAADIDRVVKEDVNGRYFLRTIDVGR